MYALKICYEGPGLTGLCLLDRCLDGIAKVLSLRCPTASLMLIDVDTERFSTVEKLKMIRAHERFLASIDASLREALSRAPRENRRPTPCGASIPRPTSPTRPYLSANRE